jgi:bifunctional UDP-N-acetylglucosamine pyrophosphorylase/glucosamine-1-phosphate N-acetyltransferase
VSLPRPAALIVLAAGQGTRMRSQLPKVLHAIAGRSLLGHVLAAAEGLLAEHTVVVVGHRRELVVEHLRQIAPAAVPVVQEVQGGTGQAARLALQALDHLDPTSTVVVVPGDTPLLTCESLQRLLVEHVSSGRQVTVLTSRVADPTGYGRVLRDADGAVTGIVEHADCTPEQRDLDEVNAGVYAFTVGPLLAALAQLDTGNAQGEEYLTDVLATLDAGAVPAPAQETAGINDRAQLADASVLLRGLLVRRLMLAGVTVVDPATTYVDAAVTVEPDVTLLPGTSLLGSTVVCTGAVIGPWSTLTDTTVGAGATVESSTCRGAQVGEQASVGPYSFLRPGTVLGVNSKVGAYVETKNVTVGEGSKVPHLSYVGDASIGARSNIGAATVFVNYDGRDKHRTEVGDDVRVGSDTMLVAPVSIGDGAYTAAGSVITNDVPPGALGVGRARQRNIEGWVARRRSTEEEST